jgi:WhiB family redox-sensing transcriptional regulator
MSTDTFFTGRHTKGPGGLVAVLNARAKNICSRCPVSAQCLDYAMATERDRLGYRHGVWGGLSPEERAQLAQQERRVRRARVS